MDGIFSAITDMQDIYFDECLFLKTVQLQIAYYTASSYFVVGDPFWLRRKVSFD